jgi:hypothetical protein
MKEHLYGYRKTGQPLIDLGIAYVLFAAKEKHLFLYMCQTISYSKVNFALIANEGVRKMYAEQIGENLEKPGKTWKNWRTTAAFLSSVCQ